MVNVPHPSQNLHEFFVDALSFEDQIVREFGGRWRAHFRAIRKWLGRIRFQDGHSDAAFYIDKVTGEFVFFNAGFTALRVAVLQVAGAGVDAEHAMYLVGISDLAYGLHELLHPEQGLTEFSIVQDHKKVPSGLDEIGKIDHIADISSLSLIAAVYAARAGELRRDSYLLKLRDLCYLNNRAAPIAFAIPITALHKQKRRLMNWLVCERIDDALRHDMTAEIDELVGPVDFPLWIHFQLKTGDVVLWQPEPMHKVLGTTQMRQDLLLEALQYKDDMERGDLLMPWRALLKAFGIDAEAVKSGKFRRMSPIGPI